MLRAVPFPAELHNQKRQKNISCGFGQCFLLSSQPWLIWSELCVLGLNCQSFRWSTGFEGSDEKRRLNPFRSCLTALKLSTLVVSIPRSSSLNCYLGFVVGEALFSRARGNTMPFERHILGRAKPFLKALISEKGVKMEKKMKKGQSFFTLLDFWRSGLLLSVLYNHSNKHSKRHDLSLWKSAPLHAARRFLHLYQF